MNLAQALDSAIRTLRLHTCEGSEPEREAEELLAFSLGADRSEILRRPERKLTGAEETRFTDCVARRLDHEPMARIFGKARFLDRDFVIDRHVLVPRPATEIIVSRAIEACSEMDRPTVIDVGTGSGCAAISLALALPDSQVYATDISTEALETASRNALAHHVADRIDFLLGDLLSNFQLPHPNPLPHGGRGRKGDDLLSPALALNPAPSGAGRSPSEASGSGSPLCIFANLPYIPTDSIYYLSPCVTAGEPLLALDGGTDGLALYRKLLDHLIEIDGERELTLFFELLPGQVAAAKQEIGKRFPRAEISEIRPGEKAEVIGLEIRDR